MTLALLAPGAQAQDAGEPTITSHVISSFDETQIFATVFVPEGAQPGEHPLIMRTHGWGGRGETEVGEGTLAKLLEAGYVVMTWDQRGFGYSGGEVQIDKPDVEGRDASALISWAVENVPEVQLESAMDPVVGFTGGSYAGGIQMATAAFDQRVDALAPEIAWTDLRYSLYAGEVINAGWQAGLYALGTATAQADGLDPRNPAGPQTGGLDEIIHQTNAEGAATNQIGQEGLDYFAASSLAEYGQGNPVTVPTLVMQGSVDTLFDLTDGNGIYQHVRAQGAPARYLIFCGGHVACPESYAELDDRAHLDEAILTWFAKYLRGEDVEVGAPVEYRTNEGVWRTADDFTPSDATMMPFSAEGAVQSVPPPAGPSPAALNATPSADGDPRAFTAELMTAGEEPVELVGLPTARLTVTGTGPTVHLFVKLVHREAGEVVNLQEASVRVSDLSEEPQEVEVTMPGVAYTLPAGHHLDLQVATQSVMHSVARTPAQAEVAVELALPVRGAATVRRLAGAERTATAAAVSADTFETATASTVVIARADQYADALAGGPLAATLDAPLLLSASDGLSATTAAEVERLGAERAVLLGGPAALSEQVAADLEAAGTTVERIGGADRYDTARLIADEVGGDQAYLTQGADADPARGWPDAVAVSGLAATQERPILLTATASLPAATAEAIDGRQQVTIVGGTASVSDAVADAVEETGAAVERIAGATRYETSKAVAEAALADGGSPAQTWLATGRDYPDALSAGPAAAAQGAVLLLADGQDLAGSPPATEWLTGHRDAIAGVTLIGGPAAVAPAVEEAVRALLDAPGG